MTYPFVVSAMLAPPPMTVVPLGHDAVAAVGAPAPGIVAVAATYVTFAIGAALAVAAFVALVALGTVPSVLSLILPPVTDRFCNRLPDSEFFLISELPLTSLLAATADPDMATMSATIATTMAPDGLRRDRCVMGPRVIRQTDCQKAGKTGLSSATTIPRRAASAQSTKAVSAIATPVRC